MDVYDDNMLVEEILCCQNDEQIQILVDSQCLDIVGNSEQSQLKLAHKQLFRVIKLFKKYLDDQQPPITNKAQLEKEKLFIENQKAVQHLSQQIKLYEGEQELLKSISFEDVKKLEDQLQRTLRQVSEYKNQLVQQKLCVICMQNQYCVLIKPCQHICLCETCAAKVTRCPIDRGRIEEKQRVFLS